LRARMVGSTLYARGQEVELPDDLAPAIQSVISHPTIAWTADELSHLHPQIQADRLTRALEELLNLSIVRRVAI